MVWVNSANYESIEEGLVSPRTSASTTSYISTFWRANRANILTFCYIILYIIYLAIGSYVFTLIEGPPEEKYRQELFRKMEEFLQGHNCVPAGDLEELIEEIIRANNRGVSASQNVSSEPNWSFGQSFFFSGTVITTIGYGHVHPLSQGGKVFCMIYAVIGIPMTFILLTAMVERLLDPTTSLLHWMNSKLGHLYQPFNIRVFHLSLMGLLFFILMMAIPSAVFAKIEPGWDFLDSIYYCFISLTTIGLGDYIPGDAPDQPYRPIYKVAITGYLLVGLTFAVLLLTLYNDIPQLNLGLFLLRHTEPSHTNDPERTRLSGTAASNIGVKYTQNEETSRQNVKVVSRPVDSPSPDEDTTPVHAQMPPAMPMPRAR